MPTTRATLARRRTSSTSSNQARSARDEAARRLGEALAKLDALDMPALAPDEVLVLAEILRGIELKRRSDPEQAKSLDRWFSRMGIGLGDRVLPIDEPAWALLGIPDPLPLIDGLLAATAKVHGLTLVTRNVADISATGSLCLTRSLGKRGREARGHEAKSTLIRFPSIGLVENAAAAY